MAHPAQVQRRGVLAGGRVGGRRKAVGQTPDALRKPAGAFDAGLGPFDIALGRGVRQHEPARDIGAVGRNDPVRVDRVLLGLRHLLDGAGFDMPAGRRLDPVIVTLLDRAGLQPAAVRCAVGLVRHHALREEARERLTHRQVQFADIPHRAREGAGIEKVQHGMFHAADVLIDGQPVGALRRIADRGKARIVPGAVHERVQRVGLPARRLSAGGAVHVFPGRVMVQRIARLVEGNILRQAHRQHLRRHRHDAADLAIDHRDRAAPIALT